MGTLERYKKEVEFGDGLLSFEVTGVGGKTLCVTDQSTYDRLVQHVDTDELRSLAKNLLEIADEIDKKSFVPGLYYVQVLDGGSGEYSVQFDSEAEVQEFNFFTGGISSYPNLDGETKTVVFKGSEKAKDLLPLLLANNHISLENDLSDTLPKSFAFSESSAFSGGAVSNTKGATYDLWYIDNEKGFNSTTSIMVLEDVSLGSLCDYVSWKSWGIGNTSLPLVVFSGIKPDKGQKASELTTSFRITGTRGPESMSFDRAFNFLSVERSEGSLCRISTDKTLGDLFVHPIPSSVEEIKDSVLEKFRTHVPKSILKKSKDLSVFFLWQNHKEVVERFVDRHDFEDLRRQIPSKAMRDFVENVLSLLPQIAKSDRSEAEKVLFVYEAKKFQVRELAEYFKIQP